MTTIEEVLRRRQAFLDFLAQQAGQLAHVAARDHRLSKLSDEELHGVLSMLSRSHGTHVIMQFLPPQEYGRLSVRLSPEVGADMAVKTLTRNRDEDLEALQSLLPDQKKMKLSS